MENSIEGWLRAESWEDIIVSSESCELLKVHHLLAMWSITADILGIDILQRAKELTHEVNHDPGVDQIDQLANLLTVNLLGLRNFIEKWQ